MSDQPVYELLTAMKEPLNAYNLRRIFLLLIKAHYSHPDNYGALYAEAKNLVYDAEDKTKSNLHIDLLYNFAPGQDFQSPSIFVGFDDMILKKEVIRNEVDISDDNSTTTLNKVVETNLIVAHVADTIDQTTVLTEITTSFLEGMSASLRCKLNLLSYDGTKMTKPSLLDKASGKRFRSDYVANLRYNHLLSVNTESHRIKKIAFELTPE